MFTLRDGNLYKENVESFITSGGKNIEIIVQDDSLSGISDNFFNDVETLKLFIENNEFYLGNIYEKFNTENKLRKLIIVDPYRTMNGFNESMKILRDSQIANIEVIVNEKLISKRIHKDIKCIHKFNNLTTYIMENNDIIQFYNGDDMS